MDPGSRDTVEAWELLREAGPSSCSTPSEFLTVLSALRRSLTYRDVAGCLSLFLRTYGDTSARSNGPPNPSASLMLGRRAAGSSGTWNLDAFVDAIPKQLNWELIIRAFDEFSDIKIKSQEVFVNVLIYGYKRGTKQPFLPGKCFLGVDWVHSDVQSTLLINAINSEEVRFEPTVEGGRDSKWSCVALVETLLRLAERGHHGICFAALQLGRAQDPDSLLLSLLCSKPAWEQLREELYAALVPALLVRALEDDADAIRVLNSVWSLNRELVIRGVLDVLTRDASVLDLVVQLPEGLAVLLRLPLRVSLAAACAAANRDPSFKLDKWLTERLSTPSAEMLTASVREVLKFVESRQQGPVTKATPRLNRACLAAIFRVLQLLRVPDLVTEVRRAMEVSGLDPVVTGSMSPPAVVAGQPGYDDIEEKANATFQLIYSGQMDIEQVIAMLSKFKDSDDPREQSIFQCMIHNLFDEYRFFQNYPDKELRITGVLFGNLIQHQLLSSWTLSMAIKYVLDALRRAPNSPPDTKIFRFGVLALEQFKSCLSEFPHFVSEVLAIPHFAESEPMLFADVERAKSIAVSPSGQPTSPASQTASTLSTIGLSLPKSLAANALPISMVESLDMRRATSTVDSDHVGSGLSNGALPLRGSESAEIYPALCKKLDSIIGGPSDEEAPASPGVEYEDQVQFLINNLTMQNLDEKVQQAKKVITKENATWTAHYLVTGRISTQANFHDLYLNFVEALGEKQLLIELRQRTLVQVRKLLKSNKIVTSTQERSVLKNLGSWLGHITLAKSKPLLHREVDLKELILDGYERGWLIAILPFASNILKGAKPPNNRVFSATNPWMAGILSTLAELYHLPEIKLNLKFEIEVLFRELNVDLQSMSASALLPLRTGPKMQGNPDFTALAATQAAAVANPLGSSAGGISNAFGSGSNQAGQQPRAGSSLSQPQQHAPQLPFSSQGSGAALNGPFTQQFPGPVYAGDEQHRQTPQPQQQQQRAPIPQHLPAQQQAQMGLPNMIAGAVQAPTEKLPIPAETVIPNLAAYVFISNSLELFNKHPDLKRVVPVAVDRAIREIIQPAVERSVSIALITTRELILKDFSMEPDETRMMKAAHLMVTNLAGSLAQVTCKEHLRMSMGNHLRQLLTSQGLSADDLLHVEQVVQTCSSENLELGCLLIEKAATDKALRDIDDALQNAVAIRKEHRDTMGQPYYDMSIFNNGMRFPSGLPQALRPRPQEGGLAPDQLAVYEAFQRAPRQPLAPGARDTSIGSSEVSLSQTASAQSMQQPMMAPRMLTPGQALDKYKAVVAALDVAVSKLLQQPGFHDLPASSLPSDHEIIQQLHYIRSIVAATIPESRFEVAVMIAQSIFKRLFDAMSTDKLRLSVQVGALEAVSSALDGLGLRGKITEWVLISIANGKLNIQVTAALVDARLVGLIELDALVADLLEGQLSPTTCAFAMELVQRCLVQSRSWQVADGTRTLVALRSLAVGNAGIASPPGLARLLAEVADIAPAHTGGGGQGSGKGQGGAANSVGPLFNLPSPGEMTGHQSLSTAPTASIALTPFSFTRNPAIEAQVRKDVEIALQRWIKVSRDGGSAAQFLQGLREKGLLKGDVSTERFFYLCTELCVESFLTIVSQPSTPDSNAGLPSSATSNSSGEDISKSRLAYTGVDSYGVLVSLLVKLADHRVRPTLAAQALEAVAKVMAYEVSLRFAQGHENGFDQRPYFRMILNFQRELLSIPTSNSSLASSTPGAKEADLAESADKLLAVFAEAHHHYFSPEHAPGFCFAWLELVSHHSFMPRLLREERGWSVLHRLLIDLFVFMEPYLKSVQLTPAVRILYKGTLRVLLVLLHDFPEFLCFFHFSLCNVIPPTCVQLRNLILSAFPRTMRLPDPFTPNLKIDLLPEISINPRILSDYTVVLDQAAGNLRADVDLYLKTRSQPTSFLSSLKDRLRSPTNWTAVLNALVLHVGVAAIAWSKVPENEENVEMSVCLLGAKDIFQTLATELDPEGRYQFLNAIANHLRYPNSHTHYFSCVILGLFKEGTELVQEQVTRVLLERLIVHRPHPWGLLVTFIELMKNPRYSFWDHSFTRCTPEIHKVFESVASSCGAGQALVMS